VCCRASARWRRMPGRTRASPVRHRGRIG
jgi:hypothetical protein